MEISYTKQQQKQKQKQRNAAQDSDTIEAFDRDKQLVVSADCDDYFAYTRHPAKDVPRTALELPLAVPVVEIAYALREGDAARTARVYPTLQFLYSHHIMPDYITPEVRDCLAGYGGDPAAFVDAFLAKARAAPPGEMSGAFVGCKSRKHFVRQNPAYALAALEPGVYVIGMKDQFNVHDLPKPPMHSHVQVCDAISPPHLACDLPCISNAPPVHLALISRNLPRISRASPSHLAAFSSTSSASSWYACDRR